MTGDEDLTDNEPDDGDLFADQLPATVDAGSPAAVSRRRIRTKLEARKGAEFWRLALGTEPGRRELYLLLQAAGTFETPFAVGPNGFPHESATWFKAGAHDLGQRLFLSLQRIDILLVKQMLDEHHPAFASRPRDKASS